MPLLESGYMGAFGRHPWGVPTDGVDRGPWLFLFPLLAGVYEI